MINKYLILTIVLCVSSSAVASKVEPTKVEATKVEATNINDEILTFLYLIDESLKRQNEIGKSKFTRNEQKIDRLEKLLNFTIKTNNKTFEKNEIPTHAVIPFNLNNCPTGWLEYEPAYGRVIRGIDNSGTTIDSEGKRGVGSLQEDSFASHIHIAHMQVGAEPKKGAGGAKSNRAAGGHGNAANHSERYDTESLLEASGSTETRSKNVALLYCEKI